MANAAKISISRSIGKITRYFQIESLSTTRMPEMPIADMEKSGLMYKTNEYNNATAQRVAIIGLPRFFMVAKIATMSAGMSVAVGKLRIPLGALRSVDKAVQNASTQIAIRTNRPKLDRADNHSVTLSAT